MSDSPPKQVPPFGLRLPPDLKAQVQEAASANNRSMNAEIVSRLEFTFADPDGPLNAREREDLRKVVMESIQETFLSAPDYKEYLDAQVAKKRT